MQSFNYERLRNECPFCGAEGVYQMEYLKNPTKELLEDRISKEFSMNLDNVHEEKCDFSGCILPRAFA
jgi:hypothetical protein